MIKALFLSVLFLGIIAIPIVLICRKNSNVKWAKITIYVLFVIWVLRFAVGLSGELQLKNNLSVGETIFDSFIHALQTFSLDEEYTSYTAFGKMLLENCGCETLAKAYGIVISVLNVCAPVLGGAVLLNIITDTFAYTKIALHPFRHKFVFSELNEESITLAEDLFRNDNYKLAIEPEKLMKKPIVIFTDAYPNEKSESVSELFERAKKLGAVCVKTDLMHLALKSSRSIDYFLIDNDSGSNISELSKLLSNENGKKVLWTPKKIELNNATEEEIKSGKNTVPNIRIFTFIKQNYENILINNICRNSKNDEDVIVRAIRDCSNMAKKLVCDVPLFLPLLGTQKKKLNISILGDGSIAEEVFKTVFWSGQIYGTELSINVFGANADLLEKKIREECPELLESCDGESEILKISPFTEERNAPYCSNVRFVKTDNVDYLLHVDKDVIDETDYYVIALGSDGKNTEVALKLKRQIARRNMVNDERHNAIIAPAVFDKEVALAIQDPDAAGTGQMIIPFGTLESRFSVNNIFMTSFCGDAEKSHKLYSLNDSRKFRNDAYTYWANITREIHVPYKMFGLGLIESFSLDEHGVKEFHYRSVPGLSEKKQYELGWIEHRRWNACMRTNGFTHPSRKGYDEYYLIHKMYGHPELHKDVDMKFHPCIVECMEVPQLLPESKEFDCEKYDCLDYVTMYTYHNEAEARGEKESADGLKKKAYKKYDFSCFDSALITELKKCVSEIEDYDRLKALGYWVVS